MSWPEEHSSHSSSSKNGVNSSFSKDNLTGRIYWRSVAPGSLKPIRIYHFSHSKLLSNIAKFSKGSNRDLFRESEIVMKQYCELASIIQLKYSIYPLVASLVLVITVTILVKGKSSSSSSEY
jgi:hypothetical protein